MNRLIIIGNGFDLGNELETSYEHFLIDYFKQLAIKASQIAYVFEKDELIDCYTRDTFVEKYVRDVFDDIKSLEDLENHFQILITNYYEDWPLENSDRPIAFRIKGEFFLKLLNKKNWTDIEKAYFESILATKISNRYDPSKIKKLNAEFEIIKKALNEYIKNVDNDFTAQSNNLHYWDLPKGNFFETLLKNESLKRQYFANSPIIKDNALIVNFNYTNIVHTYLNKNNFHDFLDNAQIINIHGNCQSDNIIFGYGDESHASYQELEDQDDIELLRNMKSFYYGFSNAYSNLMEFIEKEDFVVDIIGHSLGLSDRLLFREIFERDNCKKIKLFHRGDKDSYFKKRIALSRHFKDNTNMRNKVMDYSELDVF